MGSLALRRTKASTGPDGRPLVALPSKTVQLVTLDLGPEDRANYAALEDETRKLVSSDACLKDTIYPAGCLSCVSCMLWFSGIYR